MRGNGICFGCDGAWWGHTCDLPCQARCSWNGCELHTGTCNGCEGGWWGFMCDRKCDGIAARSEPRLPIAALPTASCLSLNAECATLCAVGECWGEGPAELPACEAECSTQCAEETRQCQEACEDIQKECRQQVPACCGGDQGREASGNATCESEFNACIGGKVGAEMLV